MELGNTADAGDSIAYRSKSVAATGSH